MLTLFALLLGPAPTVEDTFNPYLMLTQLGIGGIIAGPFIYLWRDERKRKQALETLLIEKLQGLVMESTAALQAVKEGFDTTVERIAEKSSRMDLDKALRRVEMVADELNELKRN